VWGGEGEGNLSEEEGDPTLGAPGREDGVVNEEISDRCHPVSGLSFEIFEKSNTKSVERRVPSIPLHGHRGEDGGVSIDLWGRAVGSEREEGGRGYLADNEMVDIEEFRELLHWQVTLHTSIRVVMVMRMNLQQGITSRPSNGPFILRSHVSIGLLDDQRDIIEDSCGGVKRGEGRGTWYGTGS
jgi:hypothetical protein